ncbi:pinensin family lanthipeptide [Roseivirga sp. BDSF3-8]|uniref:pinensin family lanthipeptide n=1 Tax=Roseivirga sp. BDSF3-8 TaxID=3241598 RepID=UPI0035327990
MKKKVNLDSLRVNSFVTDIRGTNFKGGVNTLKTCPSVAYPCISQGAEVCSDDSC